jgi:hypothetical protein
MKRLIAMIGTVLLATGAVAYAQQAAAPADPHHPQGQAQPPAGQQARMPGAPMGGMMPMMQMCREMMGGGGMGGHSTMGPGMMGGMMGGGMMGGGEAADPSTLARMLEMRGDMMKAMGEVMLKHARKLQEAPPAK